MANTLQVATWNVGGGRESKASNHSLWDSLTRLCLDHGADLLLLQEVADREPLLHVMFDTDDWGLYQPHGDAKEHCAITWRKKVLTQTGDPQTVKISERDPTVTSGAGAVQNKWLHRVPLKVAWVDRTCQAMVVHMVASVRGDAATVEDRRRRQQVYTEGVDNIAGQVNQWRRDGFILLGGDWNVEYDDVLLDPLRPKLELGHDQRNTKGSRAIDFIWREDDTKQKGITPTATKTLNLAPSDHKALVVSYDIT
jgi:Endonuclease/Exonuclease/phosphatase family